MIFAPIQRKSHFYGSKTKIIQPPLPLSLNNHGKKKCFVTKNVMSAYVAIQTLIHAVFNSYDRLVDRIKCDENLRSVFLSDSINRTALVPDSYQRETLIPLGFFFLICYSFAIF